MTRLVAVSFPAAKSLVGRRAATANPSVQSSTCSVLSWVPSEICAGRQGEGETEPKQIGEGTQDRTERQD